MDVTPSPKMLEAMLKLTEAALGPEPPVLAMGEQANAARVKRGLMLDSLHKLVALSMREGVNRAVKEAQARRDGFTPTDAEDRSAVAQAKDDAIAGRTRVRVRH